MKNLKKKKSKKPKLDTKPTLTTEGAPGQGFTSALNTILSKPVEGVTPILPGENEVDQILREMKKLKKQKLIHKEQKRLILNKDHLQLNADNQNWEQERKLRQIATNGVVKLFNAVREHQKQFGKELEKEKINNPKKVESLSKEKFLEILKEGKKKKNPIPIPNLLKLLKLRKKKNQPNGEFFQTTTCWGQH